MRPTPASSLARRPVSIRMTGVSRRTQIWRRPLDPPGPTCTHARRCCTRVPHEVTRARDPIATRMPRSTRGCEALRCSGPERAKDHGMAAAWIRVEL
jgi:hypothetical protein